MPRDHEPKPLVWLSGEVRTPPFSKAARRQAGVLLWSLQLGSSVRLPHSRPLQVVGKRCHELRIPDENVTWRIVYRIDRDAILILAVFSKKTQVTPTKIIRTCRRRLRDYDRE